MSNFTTNATVIATTARNAFLTTTANGTITILVEKSSNMTPVDFGVLFVGAISFIMIVVGLYFTDIEVSVERIEKWVNSVSFLRYLLADSTSDSLTQDTDAPACSDVPNPQHVDTTEMTEHPDGANGNVFVIDDGINTGGAQGCDNPAVNTGPDSTEFDTNNDNISAL